MFCQTCGNQLIEGAEVCPNCGTRVVGPSGKVGASGAKMALIAVGGVVGCLGLVMLAGFLAAVAIPKFAATKEMAYEAVMTADLHNLVAAENTYFKEKRVYAPSVFALRAKYAPSPGGTVTIGSVTDSGWRATATHSGSAKTCTITFRRSSDGASIRNVLCAEPLRE
jgi:hypothetical protein